MPAAQPPPVRCSASERRGNLANDVVGFGLDGGEGRDVEQGLGQRLALFSLGDPDQGVGNLVSQFVGQAGADDNAVVGDVSRVAEDADLLHDVGVTDTSTSPL